MKYLLYDILLHASILALSPYFFLKMVSAGKYREGISERFGFINDKKLGFLARPGGGGGGGGDNGPVLWVHAVSVGETRAVMPLVKALKKARPGSRIIFSTVTKTGQKVARDEGGSAVDAVIYLPLDLSWAVKKVIRRLRPDLFIVVEKEVWPNLYNFLKEKSIPIVVVNGTISERSFKRFLKTSFIFSEVFANIDFFCARTEGDLERALEAGVSRGRAEVVGNVKFDLNSSVDSKVLDELKKTLAIKPDERVIVAGSTHDGEEAIVIDAFGRLLDEFKGLRLVLAPRHPERFDEVERLLKGSGLDYSRRTKAGGAGTVVLLDTIGELSAVYSLAQIAFVGGSMISGVGGHNLLEPASLGKPVIYGPHLTTYLYMAEMLEASGAGLRTGDGGELFDTIKKLLSDDELRLNTGARAKEVVEKNRGAVARSMEIIEGFLQKT
ncbi:MAG TPA: 3-deoxy-D-manno-octulosonic acid transferase [Thermodesulfobacteriota bacterium]|nr:3-deoxy-D-manno-octulosonic acid transferase [Thermodesulfobacteriota bacterium]